MTQVLAIFHDAYRELNAKRMFWIVLILSGVVVLAFAAIGVSNDHLTLLWWQTPLPAFIPPAMFYKWMFSFFGVGMWLTWVAMGLAVISTAGIIPDFISGGSVDLFLSKPISRPLLFLLKYLSGLLFVALQVLVFSLASFIVVGARAGVWDPRLFLAVPLVVCFFSYLYCVSALAGLLTRSAIAAMLLTIVFWACVSLIDRGEVILLGGKITAEAEAASNDRSYKIIDGQVRYIEQHPPATSTTRAAEQESRRLENLRKQRQEHLDAANSAKKWGHVLGYIQQGSYAVKLALPKVAENNDVLDRALFSPAELQEFGGRRREEAAEMDDSGGFGRPHPEAARELQRQMQKRSTAWTLGTSLGFEAFILMICVWIFSRRDF